MLTPSVNVVQSAFPEEQQGEISGVVAQRVQPGLVAGHRHRRHHPGVRPGIGDRSYALAMASLAVIGLIGLAAALLLPSNPVQRQA
jgi:hypothetical protein